MVSFLMRFTEINSEYQIFIASEEFDYIIKVIIHFSIEPIEHVKEAFQFPHLRYCFYVSTSGSVLNSCKFKLFLAGAFPFWSVGVNIRIYSNNTYNWVVLLTIYRAATNQACMYSKYGRLPNKNNKQENVLN